MKPIVLGAHAELEASRREIPFAWIEEVIRRPLWTEPDPDPVVRRCFGPIAQADGRVLRVAIVDRPMAVFVVTAHLDRVATRRLARGERP